MSIYAKRVDGNQLSIDKAFIELGCKVKRLTRLGEGTPDLLILYPNNSLGLVEVKYGKGKLTPAQRSEDFPFDVVRTDIDVTNLVKDRLNHGN